MVNTIPINNSILQNQRISASGKKCKIHIHYLVATPRYAIPHTFMHKIQQSIQGQLKDCYGATHSKITQHSITDGKSGQ
jgi:hypothetical protein